MSLASTYDCGMSSYEVTRSALIPAPAEDVFPLVNSFLEWTKWSPWENVDPELNRSYSGSDAGVGAKYAWSGNRKAGSGDMEIVESDAPRSIKVRLEFTKPFKAVNPTTFTFTPADGGTQVTWRMTGDNKGLAKIFAMIVNMDKMVGGDFERGLAALSAAATANKA
ncbi:ribosome-associated toxin RatA of RatAB toxin-antitoxin module [Arthrobacter sp. UYNi723]